VNDTPLVDATIKAVSSSETMKTGPGGMFTMTVSPFVKFIEASYEGYISMLAEIDGSYLIFRLKEDKKYWDNKAKAEAAAKAAEEEARLAEQKRIEAERLEAERLAAEKAKAEEAARLAEEKRLAAEKAAAEKAAAEKAKAEEAARIAEQKRLEQERIAEQKRLAAEKAAAEKAAAEKAKAEEAARIAEQKRLAAAEKAARLGVEKTRTEKVVANTEGVIKAKTVKEKLKGYNSYLEVTYSLTERQDWLGLNYIGGYKFNNRFFLGVGLGANVAYDWRKMNPIPKGRLIKTVSNYSFPAFVHFRANFLKGKVSPLFALSAGVRYAPNQELPLELGVIKYNTFGMMANPQIGLNFRASKNFGVYFTAGYECFMAHSLVRNTGYSATLTSQLYSNITFNLGVNF
ncbi:MAG: TonB-dependent receptor, partial [Alistipes sp.]|nr:TonB-dependent receptor [Alistipes sp.]